VEREIGDGGGGRHAGRRVGRGIRGGGSGTAVRAITSVSCVAAGENVKRSAAGEIEGWPASAIYGPAVGIVLVMRRILDREREVRDEARTCVLFYFSVCAYVGRWYYSEHWFHNNVTWGRILFCTRAIGRAASVLRPRARSPSR
jgi:hypothetical protein